MLFRLREKTVFKFILLQTICFSCLTSSFSPRNSTVGSEQRETETVDRRRWRRDDGQGEVCYPNRVRSIVTYPGESLLLKCFSCGNQNSKSPVWNIQLTGTNEPVNLAALKRKELVREGAVDLSITRISAELGGIYICSSDETQGMYEVIVKTLPNFKVVFGQLPSEDPDKELYTNWGAWTKCSAAKCGTPGERSRIGWCSYHVRRRIYYGEGVACRSSVFLGAQKKYKDVPDKKVIQACQQECSGDYSKSSSLSDEMPKLPPMVTQKALYAKAGDTVALSCSGVSVVAYARWEVDGTMIRQIDLQKKGDKHLSIDAFHTLHIKGIRDTDKAIYGCWHNDVLHQSYKVKIVEALPNTKDAEGGSLWVGIALTFIVIAVIATGVIKAYLTKRKVVKRRT